MRNFNPNTELVLSPLLWQVFKGWAKHHSTNTVPDRSKLDPRDMHPFLESTAILERVSDSDFRFRVCGQSICNRLGMELRGMPAVSFFDPEDRQIVTECLANAVYSARPIHLDLSSTQTSELANALIMPLLGPEKTISRLFLGLDAPKTICPPNRFQIGSIRSFDLEKTRISSSAPETDIKLPQSSHHKLGLIFGGATRRGASRAQLRLVV